MASNEDLRVQFGEVVETYFCMSQVDEMRNFYKDTSHTQAIADAFAAYGMPPKNRQSTRSGWGKWTDYCDWEKGLYKFYLAAKLYLKFPALGYTDTKNCQKLKEVADALEVEKLNANKQRVSDGDANKESYTLMVINDLQSNVNAAFSNMNCSLVLSTNKKNETLADLKQATEQSDPAATADAKPTSTTNIITYIAIALVVVVFIKILKN
jgi:hypothetical protein